MVTFSLLTPDDRTDILGSFLSSEDGAQAPPEARFARPGFTFLYLRRPLSPWDEVTPIPAGKATPDSGVALVSS